MHRSGLLVVAVTLLTSSISQVASYQQTDGTIVDPILDIYGSTHAYSGNNLEPGANLLNATLYRADLMGANLSGSNISWRQLQVVAGVTGVDGMENNMTGFDLTDLNLAGATMTDVTLTREKWTDNGTES